MDWDHEVSIRAEVRSIPGLSVHAASDLFDAARGAPARYARYRRRGLSPREAYDGAMAWARNAEEQAARRCAHDTGAEREYRTW